MAKKKQARRLADNEAQAKLSSIKGSAQKARYVMDLIRGKSVEDALSELTFCRKKAAEEVKGLLESAIANAENNHNLNVDNLFVKKAHADKSFVLKRFRARARGRAAKILKPRCHMTVVVAEQTQEGNA
jgi:large subunit ribosomal protein L22